MPKSKTRPSRRHLPDRPAAPFPAEKVLETATLALLQASLEIVREAEAHITLAVRQDKGLEEALENHLLLRTASLGLLAAYSKMAGLPDPLVGHPLIKD